MKALIHHNPACGTSRKTLEILRESGADVTVNEYLRNPPDRAELKRLYDRAGISPRDGLRAKEALAEELGLTAPDVDDDTILDAMAAPTAAPSIKLTPGTTAPTTAPPAAP